MAVKVRLRRVGGRKVPFFRIVAADGRFATTGRFLENLGWYDPKKKTDNFSINMERVRYWQERGAILSDTVRSLVRRVKPAADGAPVVAPEPAAP